VLDAQPPAEPHSGVVVDRSIANPASLAARDLAYLCGALPPGAGWPLRRQRHGVARGNEIVTFAGGRESTDSADGATLRRRGADCQPPC
jgi:hypothetical protein